MELVIRDNGLYYRLIVLELIIVFYITFRKSPGWEEKSLTDGLKPMI